MLAYLGTARAFKGVIGAFTQRLLAGSDNLTMLWIGDSTFNGPLEPVRLLDPYWAGINSNYMVRNALYYEPDQTYGDFDAGVTANARLTNNVPGEAVFVDTFDRPNGPLGTESSGGQTWADNTWETEEERAVQTALNELLVTASNVGSDPYVVDVDLFWGSGATGAARVYFEYTSLSDAVFAGLTKNGVLTVFLVAGSVTLGTVDTGSDLVDGEEVHFTITVDGAWIQVECRGATITVILTAAQLSGLGGHKVLLAGLTDIAGQAWDNFLVSDILPTKRLDVKNASIGGADCASQQAELPTTAATSVIGTADIALIALGINEGADSAATFEAALVSLVTDLRVEQASVPVVVVSENKCVLPYANVAAYDARMGALSAIAYRNGWGFIDTFTGFDTANLESDGVHPTLTGSAYQGGVIRSMFPF